MLNTVKIVRQLFPAVIGTSTLAITTKTCFSGFLVIRIRTLLFFKFLKSSYFYRFYYFVDQFAADNPSNVKRFKLICYLRNFFAFHLFLIEPISFQLNHTQSVESIYPGANWAEREIFDLYGVFFSNHSDLRRILTDYGFEGFPMRKDFPLSGYVQIRYDESLRRLVLEPVELNQEYRYFEFNNPWLTKNV
jgi:NADH-quinone oxidoreductase subunit C